MATDHTLPRFLANFTGNFNTINDSTLNIYGTGYIGENSTNSIYLTGGFVSGQIHITGGVNTILGSSGTTVYLSGANPVGITGGSGILISGDFANIHITGGIINNVVSRGFTGDHVTISAMTIEANAKASILSGAQYITNQGSLFVHQHYLIY